jgi:hypothetical protein
MVARESTSAADLLTKKVTRICESVIVPVFMLAVVVIIAVLLLVIGKSK